MNSPAKPASTHPQSALLSTVGILALFTLTYAIIPWATTPGAAGLTFGAYDLAEWASLHPLVRAESPSMLTALLLRLPPVFTAWSIATYAAHYTYKQLNWWGILLIIGLIAVVLLPPLEYFTATWARSDPNYQQQAFIAAMTLLGGIIIITSGVISQPIRIATFAAAIVAGGLGLSRVHPLLENFQIEVMIGYGFWLTAVLMVILIAITILQIRSTSSP